MRVEMEEGGEGEEGKCREQKDFLLAHTHAKRTMKINYKSIAKQSLPGAFYLFKIITQKGDTFVLIVIIIISVYTPRTLHLRQLIAKKVLNATR
jgi:hypothetical protein